MFEQLLIAAMAIGGATVLWRNWLNDHPSWKEGLKRLRSVGHAMLCGSCFTYWVALAYVVLFDPLRLFVPIERVGLSSWLYTLIHFLMSWMVVSWASLVARFGYVLIQEAVGYAMHHWHEDEHHPH